MYSLLFIFPVTMNSRFPRFPNQEIGFGNSRVLHSMVLTLTPSILGCHDIFFFIQILYSFFGYVLYKNLMIKPSLANRAHPLITRFFFWLYIILYDNMRMITGDAEPSNRSSYFLYVPAKPFIYLHIFYPAC